MAKIKMYWWNEEPNFGDALNPYLVEKLSGQKVKWSPLESADIVGAGSLLQWIAKIENHITHPLHVWGAGYMFDQEPAITNPLVVHHAVRGAGSETYGKLGPITLGDAGLLADLLIKAPTSKTHKMGIVPHLWHLESPVLKVLINQNPDIWLIDVRKNPLEVIKQISECEFIYSSSLHGLIVADSFGIPNQWIQFDTPLFGGNWKFEDYYSVFDIKQIPIQARGLSTSDGQLQRIIDSYQRPGLSDIKQKLLEVFPYAQGE